MKRILTAFVLAATLATPMATPAQAGGVLTLNIEAGNAHDAHAIRSGLVLYQVFREIKTDGHISQNGIGNIASLAQGGTGNIGIIHQHGNGHSASLTQKGGHNSCGVFQFGTGASSHVTQSGGQACIVLQHGF